MHLQSKIFAKQNIDQVTNFFYHPSSLAKWDRSVKEMIPISSSAYLVGATFATIVHPE